MHSVCRAVSNRRVRALLYALAPDAPAAYRIVCDDLGRAASRKPLRPSGTSHHFWEKRRSQNPDGIASRAPDRPIGLIPDWRQRRHQAPRNNQESPRIPACANWTIASIPFQYPYQLLSYVKRERSRVICPGKARGWLIIYSRAGTERVRCLSAHPAVDPRQRDEVIQHYSRRSPLRVRLGHLGDLPLRPLHPWERTSSASLISSEKCHKRTFLGWLPSRAADPILRLRLDRSASVRKVTPHFLPHGAAYLLRQCCECLAGGRPTAFKGAVIDIE